VLSLANLRLAIGLAAFAGLAATPAGTGFAQQFDAASRIEAANAVTIFFGMAKQPIRAPQIGPAPVAGR